MEIQVLIPSMLFPCNKKLFVDIITFSTRQQSYKRGLSLKYTSTETLSEKKKHQ